MDSPQDTHKIALSRARINEEIRSHAMTFLIAGGICMYFGFAWVIDAPTNADERATELWYNIDYAFQWILRGVGALFLLAAALAHSGQRLALWFGMVAEGIFVLLMLTMALETTLETRAAGAGFDPFVILFLILAVMGMPSIARLWKLCRAAAAISAVPPETPIE